MLPSHDLLAQLGPILLLGTTILLGIGALAVTTARQPVLRQRLGEITVGVTLVWMALACVPLDRVDWTAYATFERHAAATHSGGAADQQGRGGATAVLRDPAAAPSPVGPSLESRVTVGGDQPRESIPKPATRAAPLSGSADGPAAKAAHWTRVIWWPPAWMLLYLLGSVLCGMWLILGHILLLRVQVAAQPAPDWLRAAYQNVVASRSARLVVSARTQRPFSYGILRPTIVLPADVVQPQYARTLGNVLRHEQAHIERRDAWGHALFSLAFPVLYGHPLYWFHRSKVQFARELIADDWAAAEQSKPDYADDLLHLLQSRNMSWVRSIGMLGIFQFRSSLARRIKMLLERTDRLAVCASRTFVSFAAATGLLLLIAATSVLGMRVSAATGESDGVGSSSQDHSLSIVSQAADRTELKKEYAVDGCVLLPAREVQVPATEGGVLDQLEVREGMAVAAGQFLAHIADEPVQDQRLAELERDAAKMQAENDTSVRLAEMAIKITQADFEEGKTAHARVPNSVSDFDLRRREFQWQRSELQREQAEREHAIAGINAAVAQQKVIVAKRQIDRRRVEAPFAGVVERVVPKMGEWLERGDPILHLVGIDRLRVEGFVPSEDFLPPEVFGKPVTVEVQVKRGQIERFTSKINFVSPTIGADGTFRISAELENRMTNETYYAVWPGLSARMILHTQPTAADGSRINE